GDSAGSEIQSDTYTIKYTAVPLLIYSSSLKNCLNETGRPASSLLHITYQYSADSPSNNDDPRRQFPQREHCLCGAVTCEKLFVRHLTGLDKLLLKQSQQIGRA